MMMMMTTTTTTTTTTTMMILQYYHYYPILYHYRSNGGRLHLTGKTGTFRYMAPEVKVTHRDSRTHAYESMSAIVL